MGATSAISLREMGLTLNSQSFGPSHSQNPLGILLVE